jgi:hypothetical protein
MSDISELNACWMEKDLPKIRVTQVRSRMVDAHQILDMFAMAYR